jgi:N-(2-amino-2-carboxyethyl)-L-glutamate synthase
MIHDSVLGCIGDTPVVRLARLFPDPGVQVLAKLEFLNPGGSVKDRPALHIITEGLRDGTIKPDSHLVESTSGNFGIALAMVCRVHGLCLTVVVDPDITPANLALLQRLATRVEMVPVPDHPGAGYLGQRLRRVRELLEETPHAVWINQYANELNWRAHERTGAEIQAQVGNVDFLVAAVSTSGTIHGVTRTLRRTQPGLKVIAVDARGSVIFGGAPGRRCIPGIGASRVPELLSPEEIDEVIYVSDEQAVSGCHALLAEEGILAGGSSGSVVAALRLLLPTLPRMARPVRLLTVLPDRADRYVELIYAAEPRLETRP